MTSCPSISFSAVITQIRCNWCAFIVFAINDLKLHGKLLTLFVLRHFQHYRTKSQFLTRPTESTCLHQQEDSSLPHFHIAARQSKIVIRLLLSLSHFFLSPIISTHHYLHILHPNTLNKLIPRVAFQLTHVGRHYSFLQNGEQAFHASFDSLNSQQWGDLCETFHLFRKMESGNNPSH